MNEDRLRAVLEIATAVLLGLVSVATAAGAYQSSVWSQESGEYFAIGRELRDISLSEYIESGVASTDDAERLFAALNLEFQIMDAPANVDELIVERDVLLDGASPGLAQQWEVWAAGGYAEADFPTASYEYVAATFAPSYSANAASVVAYEMSDTLAARSVQQAVAAAIFALALLLLGVAGANASLKVAFALSVGGAAAFVAGLVVSVLAAIG